MALKRRRFFKGWYFKHRTGEAVFAAIPGYAIDERGNKEAFIQTISNGHARYFSFPHDRLWVREDALMIRIGDNRFSREGMSLALDGVRAEFRYGPITPLAGGDIMGPFRHVPFMECFHGVVSLRHAVDGYAQLEGEKILFDGGSGYIEMDWGRSFPRRWVWMECHDFEERADASLMLAVAEIPFLGARFTGIIGVVTLGGEQRRIATYRLARIAGERESPGRYQVEVKQGKLALTADVNYREGCELRAPMMGKMSRLITEAPCCELDVVLRESGRSVLMAHGRCCGFERVN